MEQIVWVTKVVSRNVVSDFLSNLKNIVGGRLKSYERMIDNQLKEVTKEFHHKYPESKEVRIEFTEFTQGALAIIVHGVVNVSH